jgi:hypothetical protein
MIWTRMAPFPYEHDMYALLTGVHQPHE